MPEPHPHFTLGGVPVRVEWSFWLIAVLLGVGARDGWLLVAWVAIVFVSILVHEMGHAVALRLCHQQPHVTLQAFGGVTVGSAAMRSRAKSVAVSAAGPVAAFVLLGLPALLYRDSIDRFADFDWWVVVHDIAWVNIAWSIVNLLPILPLDGGNIAHALFGERTARVVSIAVAAAAGVYFFQQENQFAGFFLLMFAMMNFGALQQERAAPVRGPAFDIEQVRRIAQAGHAPAAAAQLLGPGGAGVDAATQFGAYLHYAECFRDAAAVGELLYADPRSDRARAAFDTACAWARAGEPDRAIAWLDRAVDAGFGEAALLDGEPDLATLRLRPEWGRVRQRVL